MATSRLSGGIPQDVPRYEDAPVSIPNRPLYLAAKRLVDVAVSFALLILLLPVLGLIALAVRVDSPGRIFFPQTRVGRGGQTFTIYKIRSMVAVAPAYTVKVLSSDPRVTRVGRFLRMSGLDELPQMLNVLKGDMSLIGPRPELPFIVDMYEPWQQQRHLVTPGITGWWQVHHRNEVPMHHGIDFDLFYIEHMGPRLDAHIVLRTVVIMWQGATRALRGG